MNKNNQYLESIQGMLKKLSQLTGFEPVEDQYLDWIDTPPEDRGNRLCVSVSDIHLTDGTVGFQNLGIHAWEAFYNSVLQRCKSNKVNEVLFILDGDIVDMIRSSKWAENDIYPWERERKEEFSKVVNLIIKDIVGVKHKDFFAMLSGLKERLEKDAGIKKDKVKIVITVGNHDKELLCDQKALKYFYEKGLGIPLNKINVADRREIGRMYGDETMFENKKLAPYFPFYYGDCGFRFFTTHGQWRDKENSRMVVAEKDMPGWSVNDGWNIDTWKKLNFSPFFLPCFGDTVAAGVLSTFIYKVKLKLNKEGFKDQRLECILDELDLYRPTYAGLQRILEETASMRSEKRGIGAVKIIEDTLYDCIIQWLSWEFTYQTSPLIRQKGLRFTKIILEKIKSTGCGLEIKAIYWLMKLLNAVNRHHRKGISLREMKKFPSFMREYHHYNFQIHGEGHTHTPAQEEPNMGCKHSSSYINFGTWRDQVIPRKNTRYRRRSVLRALYILDLKNDNKSKKTTSRVFDYFVEDIVHWGDLKDALDQNGRVEPTNIQF